MNSFHNNKSHIGIWLSLSFSMFIFTGISTAQGVTFSDEILITDQALGAISVFSADLDGDGDYDVLSASKYDGKIAWYENMDGQGSFGPQQIITTSADDARFVFGADLDGDGDYDVLSASNGDDKIAWYENTDGVGTFGSQQIITTSADGAWSVFSADLDCDGDYDILSASRYDDKIAWYENTDGMGSFGPQQIITTSAQGAISVFSADLDGDGDYDVLSASNGDDKIAWYENTDGLGSFSPQQIISTSVNYAWSVFSADLDGDGDNDVLSASSVPDDQKIIWYENTDGMGTFGTQQIINISEANSVFSADLDGDGDYDVLSASDGEDEIAWYENSDGLGSFSSQQIITISADDPKSVFSADLDGDGDFDVLSASFNDNKIAWYRNLVPPGVDEESLNSAIPKSYKIRSIYPNPFNPTTTITFDLPVASQVKLDVFDISGRNVGAHGGVPSQGVGFGESDLQWYSPGTNRITFDGSGLSSGIYIYRLTAGEFTGVGKMVLMK